MSKMRYSKQKLHVFFVFVFCMLLQEKQKKENNKMEKSPQTYKNSVFKVVIQKWKN